MSGEAGAVGGYYSQYSIAAWEIYAALLDESLEWIKLAAADAGNLDDVLLGCKDKVLACQVKDRSGSLTYHSLINNADGLLVKMYQGWKKLGNQYPGKEIDVRLITTQSPSDRDQIASYVGAKKQNFKEFHTNFWDKIRDGKKISHSWKGTVQELTGLLDCSEEILFAFIRSTHLSFSYRFPEERDYNPITWKKVKGDTDKIRHFIFDLVGKERQNLHLSCHEFIQKVGFTQRLQTYFQHDFLIDEQHYQPISASIVGLNALIETFPGGYIALTGSAGSGKSTLLSKWLQLRNDRVLKYYSYINQDMTYDTGYRGESKYFLHDIITQIHTKLGSRDSLVPDNRIDLAASLGAELKKLSDNFKQNGQKTFIIVDGLDHIEREQKVEFSLLKDLPDPAMVPPGVYFILGSRTVDGLHDLNINIRQHINKEGRSVEIAALSKSEMSLVVNSYPSLHLRTHQLDNLFANTLGHPLFLRYTVEKLLFGEKAQADKIIAEQQFTGNIHDEYDKFWLTIKEDEDLRQLLGIVSRFRFSFIDIYVLETDFDFFPSTLSKFQSKARYFFTVPAEGKWQYFHNSFKWFIEHVTAVKELSGSFDESTDRTYHKKIALATRQSISNYRWNLVYHLARSEQYGEIVSVATLDYFRNQWFEFRNPRLIREDIAIAARAAYFEDSLATLTRYIFAASEIDQRTANFNPSQYFELFLFLKMYDIADSYIIEGKGLLVSRSVALDYAVALKDLGMAEESRKIFELAEPNFILYHSRQVDTERYSPENFTRTDEVELIIKWAGLAAAYYPLDKIIALLEGLEVTDQRYRDEPDMIKRKKNLSLGMIVKALSAIVDTSLQQKDFDTAMRCVKYLYSRIGEHAALLRIVYNVLFASDPVDKGTPLIEFCTGLVSSWKDTADPDVNLDLALLFVYRLVDLPKARLCFTKLPKPLLKKHDMVTGAGNNVDYLFDYARLCFILLVTSERELLDSLPEVNDKDEKVLYNQVCNIAFHYSQLYKNSNTALSDISVSLKNILLFFHRGFLEMSYPIKELKTEVLGLFTNLVHKDSQAAYKGAINIISEDWHAYREFWRVDDIRAIINRVSNDPEYAEWCAAELGFVEDRMLMESGPYERTEQCISQAFAWMKLDKQEKSLTNLSNAFMQPLGIGNDKDYQLDYLVDWLSVMGNLDRENTKARLHWYTQRLPFLRDTARHAHVPATTKLLKNCLEWHPGNAFEFARWLLLESLIDFSEVVEILTAFAARQDTANANVYVKIFTHILLFFQDRSDCGAEAIPILTLSLGSSDKLSALIEEVQVYGMEEKRNLVIQKIIRHAQEQGIPLTVDQDDFPIKEKGTTQEHTDVLELTSGDKFLYEDLMEKITDEDTLLEMVEKEKRHSRFQWTKLLPHLNIGFSDRFIEKFIAAADFDAPGLADLGMMLYQLGYKDMAKKIAYQALEISKPAGWVRQYDGGSKIKPFELLKLTETAPLVRQLLLNELALHFKELSPKYLADDILDVLGLVLPQGSAEYTVIYKEVENYTSALFATATVDTDVFRFDAPDEAVPELFTRFTVFLLEFPVAMMKEQVETLMVASYPTSTDFVKGFLEHLYGNGYYESFLNILNGIQGVQHEQVAQYQSEIVALTSHARMDIVASAKNLLKRTGVPAEWTRTHSALPLAYVMEFDNRPELIVDRETRLKRIEEDGGLRDTNDPIEFIGYYQSAAKSLSREAKIPLLNIAHRIMQLTKEEKLPLWYDEFSEKKLTAFLESIALKVSYVRPRMIKLQAALARVAKELWNSGTISVGAAKMVCDDNDPLICSILPRLRPKFISPLLKEEYKVTARHYDFNEKWVEALDASAFDQLKLLDDGKCIIAESTTLKSYSDGRPCEHRKSFISFYEEVDKEDQHFFSSSLYNLMIAEYCDDDNDETDLLFANFVNSFDPRRNWLAINPAYAIGAGWTLAEEGLFRWVDDEGKIMVESFFWRDGNYMNNQRFFESQGGYGWCVLASIQAIEELTRVYQSPIFIQKKIDRKYRFVQKRYNTDIDAKKTVFETRVIQKK